MREKKDFLESYYKKVRHYLVSDITSLKKSDDSGNDTGCGPYLLATSSGIDFLGNLSCPGKKLKDNPSRGFKHYVIEFLGKINPKYKAEKVADFIYKIIRCGQVHEAIVKHQVIIGKKPEHKKYHLRILSIRNPTDQTGKPVEIIYFNPRIFADDFLNSLRHFGESFDNAAKIKEMADRLEDNLNLTSDEVRKTWPDLEREYLDEKSIRDLYEWGSASPHQPEGSLIGLRNDFWRVF